MTNPYGITLNRAWTEWATNYGVSPTVAAAVFLISVHRPAYEIAAKLTACEFKQVTDIVRRWPNNFASGTLAALETQKHAAQRELTTSTSTDVASGRPGAGIKASAEDTRRTHECNLSTEKAGTHPGTLADIASTAHGGRRLKGAGPKHPRHRRRNGDTALLGPSGCPCDGARTREAGGGHDRNYEEAARQKA